MIRYNLSIYVSRSKLNKLTIYYILANISTWRDGVGKMFFFWFFVLFVTNKQFRKAVYRMTQSLKTNSLLEYI